MSKINKILFENCNNDIFFYEEVIIIIKIELNDIFNKLKNNTINIKIFKEYINLLLGILFYLMEESNKTILLCKDILKIDTIIDNDLYIVYLNKILNYEKIILKLL